MSKVTKEREFKNVSIGDRTKYPNLKPCSVASQSLLDCVESENHNGYVVSTSSEIAEEALLHKYKTANVPEMTHKDIFFTSGCSDALSTGTILLPKPGYHNVNGAICKRCGINHKYYNCLQNDWEFDLKQLESLILMEEKNTK